MIEALTTETDWPCWLTPAQSAEAKALMDMGFGYLGIRDWHPDNYDFLALKSGEWEFYSDEGFRFVDGFCDEATFSLILLDWDECPSDDDYQLVIRKIKSCLRRARRKHKAEKQKNAEFFQLTLKLF